jgi:hypothetical protein
MSWARGVAQVVIKRSRAAAGWRRRSSERNMSERTAGF